MFHCTQCEKDLPVEAITTQQLLSGKIVYYCRLCGAPCQPVSTMSPAPSPPAREKLRIGAVDHSTSAYPESITARAASLKHKTLPPMLAERVNEQVDNKTRMGSHRPEKELTKNPWLAIFFPLKISSFFSILTMMLVFSGMDILMEMTFTATVPETTTENEVQKEPAKAAPAPNQKPSTSAPRPPIPPPFQEVRSTLAPEFDPGGPRGRIEIKGADGEKKVFVLGANGVSQESGPVVAVPVPPVSVPTPRAPPDEGLAVVPPPAEPDPAAETTIVYTPENSEEEEDEALDLEEGGELSAFSFLTDIWDEDGGGHLTFGGFLMGFMALGATAFALKAFIYMYFFAMLQTVIVETVNDRENFPKWPNPMDVIDSYLVPAWHFIASWLACFAPALGAFIAAFYLPQLARELLIASGVLFLLACYWFPMTFMCVSVRGDLSGLSPSKVLPALMLGHINYIPAVLFYMAVFFLPLLPPLWSNEALGPMGAILLNYFLFFALLVASMRALGVLYRRLEDHLKWFSHLRAM